MFFNCNGPGLGVTGATIHDSVLIGECRAWPPERHSIFNRNRVWPLVGGDDWCGEFNDGEGTDGQPTPDD